MVLAESSQQTNQIHFGKAHRHGKDFLEAKLFDLTAMEKTLSSYFTLQGEYVLHEEYFINQVGRWMKLKRSLRFRLVESDQV